jgi:isoleucyl-tRNA synthetase
MDLVRATCSAALGLRKARQLRVRLPLGSLTVAHPSAESLAPFADLIRDEVNVKDVRLDPDPASLGTFELAVNPRVLGPRLGSKVQEVIRAVKSGDWTKSGDTVTAAGVDLGPGEYELKLVPAGSGAGGSGAAGAGASAGTGAGATRGAGTGIGAAGGAGTGIVTTALPGSTGLLALDTELTPELEAEGTARDVVRSVQQARRDAGLEVSDRIRLTIGADEATAAAIEAHADFLKAETLAVELTLTPATALTITLAKG